MKRLKWSEIISVACRAENKLGVYVSACEHQDSLEYSAAMESLSDGLKALFGRVEGEHVFADIMIDSRNLFLFDTDEEQMEFFELFIGDVSDFVFAMTLNRSGCLEDENT